MRAYPTPSDEALEDQQGRGGHEASCPGDAPSGDAVQVCPVQAGHPNPSLPKAGSVPVHLSIQAPARQGRLLNSRELFLEDPQGVVWVTGVSGVAPLYTHSLSHMVM